MFTKLVLLMSAMTICAAVKPSGYSEWKQGAALKAWMKSGSDLESVIDHFWEAKNWKLLKILKARHKKIVNGINYDIYATFRDGRKKVRKCNVKGSTSFLRPEIKVTGYKCY